MRASLSKTASNNRLPKRRNFIIGRLERVAGSVTIPHRPRGSNRRHNESSVRDSQEVITRQREIFMSRMEKLDEQRGDSDDEDYDSEDYDSDDDDYVDYDD